jgi:hypothetical protein
MLLVPRSPRTPFLGSHGHISDRATYQEVTYSFQEPSRFHGHCEGCPLVCPLDVKHDDNSGASEIRPAMVNLVPCLDQQTEPQDRGFIQPSGDQLYVDRQVL